MAEKLTMKFREMFYLIFCSFLFFIMVQFRPRKSHFGNTVLLGTLEIANRIDQIYEKFYKKESA